MGPTRRGIVVAVVAATPLAVGTLVAPDVAIERARSLIYGPWFPVALVGLYLLRPAFAWPIAALSVLVGFRYGVAVGVPVALVGAIGTSLVPYAVARYVRTDAGWLGRATHGSERFFDATGDARGVVAARLAPTPAEVVSAAAGIGRVSLPAFVAGTAVGEFPWTVAAVVIGASMHRLSIAGSAVDPRLVLAGVAAALLVLAGPAYRYARRAGPRAEPDD